MAVQKRKCDEAFKREALRLVEISGKSVRQVEEELGERACRLLEVSTSGYYAWQQRQAHPKPSSDEPALVTAITRVFEESRGTYGSPRVTAALRQRGMVCNRKRVARLMRKHHLVAKYHHRRRTKTTDSRHGLPIAPNRLNREFSAQRPNEKWVADITYIDTVEGWYNRRRLHSALGCVSPEQFENQFLQDKLFLHSTG